MRWKILKGIVLIGTGLVLLLGCLNIVFRPFEPHYDGKPLRYWVHRLGQPANQEFLETTDKAMTAIGARATPWLTRLIDSPDNSLVDSLVEAFWRKYPDSGGHYLAATGAYWRACALCAIERFDMPATNAVPQIVARLHDADARVRIAAAIALEGFPTQHQLAVPGLIKATGDSELEVVTSAIWALKKFGTNAVPAIPKLSSLTNHHEPDVRRIAVHVLDHMRTNSPAISGSGPLAPPIK